MMQLFVVEPQPRTVPLLKNHHQVRVAGSAGSTGAGLNRGETCDLILVSAALPAPDILHFLRQQRDKGPRVVIVEAQEAESQIIPFLEAGAAGYVAEGADANEMVSVLNAVHAGEAPLAPEVGTALVERMHELLALQEQRAGQALLENCPDLSALTAREREILMLIRAGASNRTIASELMIEPGTVKNHVHSILKKLNVRRREQAASYADLLEQTET
jgi:DNA-binding NarL/FixJ family response regulator